MTQRLLELRVQGTEDGAKSLLAGSKPDWGLERMTFGDTYFC
jgi:hypothetical protein